MINNNVSAHVFYNSDKFKRIYDDYLKWKALSDDERSKLSREFELLSLEETPALVLKRHGTMPPENWQEITDEIRKRHGSFFEEHPYFYLFHVVDEIKSVIEACGAVFKNAPRKGRAPIKEVNIIKNDEYLVFEYNRLINSTQTSVVFTGVPLKYIELIDELAFLRKYIPNQANKFTIDKSILELPNERFTFYHLQFEK